MLEILHVVFEKVEGRASALPTVSLLILDKTLEFLKNFSNFSENRIFNFDQSYSSNFSR